MRQIHLGLVIGLLFGALSMPAVAAKHTRQPKRTEKRTEPDSAPKDRTHHRLTSGLGRVLYRGFEFHLNKIREAQKALVEKIKKAESAHLKHGIPGLRPILLEGHTVGAQPFKEAYRMSKYGDGLLVKPVRLGPGGLMINRHPFK